MKIFSLDQVVDEFAGIELVACVGGPPHVGYGGGELPQRGRRKDFRPQLRHRGPLRAVNIQQVDKHR